jgi:hypothetical protein
MPAIAVDPEVVIDLSNAGEIEAEIHHFTCAETGDEFEEEDGEVLDGWYWRFVYIKTKKIRCGLHGPYESGTDAEEAARKAHENHDY